MEEQLYENRKFMIFNVSELELIDFTTVCQTSSDTVRKSLDDTKTLVKWDSVETPTCVESLTTKEGPYTYDEIIIILSGPEWTSNELLDEL
jgi:hypothetical protein